MRWLSVALRDGFEVGVLKKRLDVVGGGGRGIGVVWHLEWENTGGCVGDCQCVEVVDSGGGPVKIW